MCSLAFLKFLFWGMLFAFYSGYVEGKSYTRSSSLVAILIVDELFFILFCRSEAGQTKGGHVRKFEATMFTPFVV